MEFIQKIEQGFIVFIRFKYFTELFLWIMNLSEEEGKCIKGYSITYGYI